MNRIYRTFKAGFAAAAMLFLAACAGSRPAGVNGPAAESVRPGAVRVSAETDASEPAIAADKDGNVYVVYVEHADGGTADVFLQKYGKDLGPAGQRVRVSPDGTAKTWRGDPPAAAIGPDGSVYVSWTRSVKGSRGVDLVVSASRDGGQTFEPPVKVNDDTKPASHGMHSLAVGSDGRVYVAWLDERNVRPLAQTARVGDMLPPVDLPAGYEFVRAHNGKDHAKDKPAPTPNETTEESEPNSEVFFSLSTDGGKSFAANKKIASDVCPCCKTSLLVAADGRLYLSWRQVLAGDLRHIAVASTTDGGGSFGERVIVSDDQWQLHACPVSGPAMSESNGKLTVTWYTAGNAGEAGLYSADSLDKGKSFGPRRLISSQAAAGTPIRFGSMNACVYATGDNDVVISDIRNRNENIEDATVPAAAFSNGSIVTAFVRHEGNKRAVWMVSAAGY